MATRPNGKNRSSRNGRRKRVSSSGRTAGRMPVGKGTLLIIGGHERKDGDTLILREVVKRLEGGKLVVATVASSDPEPLWEEYEKTFRRLGCRHVWHLNVGGREDAMTDRALAVLRDARGVFFTGGDQLKITSQIGDTPVYERVREIFEAGGLIAGTSAGASVMCETMLVSGDGDESNKIGGALRMAPGLGLADGLIIDQHFAERGRMGRLVGAVTQNPRLIGVGIDENTAILLEQHHTCTVLGEGAVYVLDGRRVGWSNLSEEAEDRTLSVFDLKLHILSMGDVYDLRTRRPRPGSARELEDRLLA